MSTQFTKDTMIVDLLEAAPDVVVPLLQSHGMSCFGCSMSGGKTLEQACMTHGVDPDIILEQLAAIAE
jgi:hybrid cluster-associated redox disulfide protein